MQQQAMLHTRAKLRSIIEAYETFLRQEILSGEKSITASELIVARDLNRTIAFGTVNKTRVDNIISPPEQLTGQPATQLGSSSSPLFAEAGVIGSSLSPEIQTQVNSDKLFRNLKDCIPCNRNWEWQDFDWERLKDILSLDIESRFAWLTDIDDLLNDNSILDRLCQFMQAFKNLCPQDLLVLIAMFTAWLYKTLDSIKFNLEGILRDVLGMVLRPYISGLEDFLNAYIQFFVDQIECILNSIITTAAELEDLSISNDLGPDFLHFDTDVITGKGDEALRTTQNVVKRASQLINEDRKVLIHKLTDDWPTQLVQLSRDALEWIELQVIQTQDMVIDLLFGEWLVTGENISYAQQLKSVATIIQLLKAIYSLGIQKDWCTEDNAVRIVEFLNNRLPDTVIVERVNDESVGGSQVSNQRDIPGRDVVTNSNTSSTQPSQANTRTPSSPIDSSRTINISLKCLRARDGFSQDEINKYMRELIK